MNGFSADWLGLREPADFAARPPQLVQWLNDGLDLQGYLSAMDLATGTGSNLRYLAPRLGRRQDWTLIDHDPVLLAAIPARLGGWTREHALALQTDADVLRVSGPAFACRITCRQVELLPGIESLDLAGLHLVTTAALLDLVSEHWLTVLVRRCHESGVAVLFALNYDGRIEFSQPEPEDDQIIGLVNRHQRTDKGFGRALGPDACAAVMALLNDAGYRTRYETSNWHLGPDDMQLQSELVAGWAAAATEMAPDEAVGIAEWRERRLRHVGSGNSRLKVGHLDVAGIL